MALIEQFCKSADESFHTQRVHFQNGNAHLDGKIVVTTTDVITPHRKLQPCPMLVLRHIAKIWTEGLIWLKLGTRKFRN